jgi:hypothetical protein
MAKPYIHAKNSVKRYGGVVEDYIEIHNLMDSSKATIADNRHRALTHNAWFVGTILEKIFGTTITNSEGKVVSVRDIGEEHVLEDYGMRFIPTAQDFLAGIPMQEWMQNGKGEPPNSFQKIDPSKRPKKRRIFSFDEIQEKFPEKFKEDDPADKKPSEKDNKKNSDQIYID